MSNSNENLKYSGDGNGYRADGAHGRLYVIGRTPGRKFRVTVCGDAELSVPVGMDRVTTLKQAQAWCEEYERDMVALEMPPTPVTSEGIDDTIELGDDCDNETEELVVLPAPVEKPVELTPEQERVLDNLDKEFRSSSSNCKPVGREILPPRRVLGYALKNKRHGSYFKDYARDPVSRRVNDNAAVFTPDERGALLSSSEFAAHALVSGVMYPAHWKVVAVKG